MRKISRKVYEQIQEDVPLIDEQLNKRYGSQAMWNKLKPKYSILLPGIMAHIRQSAKISVLNQEPDYRPQLIQLKEAILSYLIMYGTEELTEESLNNKSSEILSNTVSKNSDHKINELIEESKLYIRSSESSKKQIALERIWDAFERLKTINSTNSNKKESAKDLIKNISHNSDSIQDLFDKEFRELTRIGNHYQIRHYETNKHSIPSNEFREYLYFRTLSLISYCLNEYES